MLKLGFCKSPNNSICNISNSTLKGEEVLGQTVATDFVLQEFNQVPGNGLRGFIRWGIGHCLILVIRLNDCNNFFSVDRNVGSANTVFWGHNEIWFSMWGKLGHGNIV
jgi:hypothetical protein